MGVIRSDLNVAKDAVSTLVGLNTDDYPEQTVSMGGGSNPAGMTEGATAAHTVLTDIANLMNCVNKQAQKFPALASRIAERDLQDAQRWEPSQDVPVPCIEPGS